MRPRACPACGLLNPSDALFCDCGYKLPPVQVEPEPAVEQFNELVSLPATPQVPSLTLLSVMFSYRGRITRSTFWIGLILLPLVFCINFLLGLLIATLLSLYVEDQSILLGFVILPLLGGLYVLLPWSYFALCAKRWHDQDQSGWMSLIILIPFIGLLTMPLFCGIPRGTPGPNKYGLEPRSYDFVLAIGRFFGQRSSALRSQ